MTLIPAIGGASVVGTGVRLAAIGRTCLLPWDVALRLALILLRWPARIGRAGIRRTLSRLWPALHLRALPGAALRPGGLRTLRTRCGSAWSRLGAALAVSPRRGRA